MTVDDGRCRVGLWESEGAPNPHLMKQTQFCSEAAGHEGVIHKHGSYVWLADGDRTHASTQRVDGAPTDESEAQAIDALTMALDHVRAAELALEWGREKLTEHPFKVEVEHLRHKRDHLLGLAHDRERRLQAASKD